MRPHSLSTSLPLSHFYTLFLVHVRPEEGTPIPSLDRLYPSQTKPYLEAKAEIEKSIVVSELQIKKEATNGFDRPGHCFFGDQALFRVAEKYPLPDSLSTCRVLREGGNGVVLEVRNEFLTLTGTRCDAYLIHMFVCIVIA